MNCSDLVELAPGPEDDPSVKLLAVGWLGEGQFPTREPSSDFLDKLFLACLEKVAQTRGFHLCPFCEDPVFGPLAVERLQRKNYLGTAEIRVPGRDRVVFAAPTLIYHYVEAHHYAPPEEFVKAVMSRS